MRPNDYNGPIAFKASKTVTAARRHRASSRQIIALLFLFLLALPSLAIMERDNWPWDVKLSSHHDKELSDAVGDKWYLNLGPTGLRARIYPDKPTQFVVKYVFQDSKSPAKGKIKIGDVIAGANGSKFSNPHRFGRYPKTKAGWDGPMMDLAKHIEDSQGKDGKLHLIVWPNGNKAARKTVALQLKPVGRFSPSFPYNCKRSDRLMVELCDFIQAEYERTGKFNKGAHTHGHSVLALMAAGEQRHEDLAKKIISAYASKRYDSKASGFASWRWGYDGIVMGESYLRYKDSTLAPAMKSLSTAMEEGQTWKAGGYSHRPNPFIMERIAGGGPAGYGAMATPGGLTMLAQSLFKAGGLPYSKSCYERIHQAYLKTVNPKNGAVGYGFSGWDHAVIVLEGTSKSAGPRGIGFECPTGMKHVNKFSIQWPTKADPRYRDTSWLKTEKNTIRVYDYGGQKRLAVRDMSLAEPAGAYNTTSGSGHQASAGLGALAHLIGNKGNRSWEHLGNHMAKGCALAPGELLDGHAAASIHALWGPLAATRADSQTARNYLDYLKSWIIISETHNGGLIIQPWGRDRPGSNSDPHYGPRLLPTASAALILSISKRRLQITGAGSPPTTTPLHNPITATPQPLRKARTLSTNNRTILNNALLATLAKLSDAGKLRPIPLRLSKTKARVWLAKADKSGALTFQVVEGAKSAVLKFADFPTKDLATLSELAAALRDDSTDTQAMAAVYMESLNRMGSAEKYYAKSNESSRKKLQALFE